MSNTSTTTHREHRLTSGFTLIELMIAIAVVAILATIAIPSYQNYILKSGRADAKAALYGVAQTLERCYTRFSAYNDDDCALSESEKIMSENEKYEVTVTTLNANDFLLTAEPQGGQTKDSECGDFTLDHTGQKGAKGGTEPAIIEKCW